MKILHTSFSSFNASKINENADIPSNIDETILDSLVELVGSEEDVEECAKEAFEDLQKAFERDEINVEEIGNAESLVISSLIVKLVEKGKLGPEEADAFLEEKI
jgi:hypothetical protein